MQTLASKILTLKATAYLAGRTATFWQQQIDTHGEQKAEAFYRHLGLNHLSAKSVDFDGLTLRRHPRPSEALAIKGVAQVQTSSRDKLATILLKLRSTMITDALIQLGDLNPADLHTLVVAVPATEAQQLRTQLLNTFNDARLLVQHELAAAKQTDFIIDVDDFDELDTLADITVARVANDTQARIIGAATRLALLGTQGTSLITATQTEILAGSVSYIDRTATGLANRTISLGRGYEAEQRRDEWATVEYSALLDSNVCGPCADADGLEANNEADLPPAPNPECEGLDNCRCFHVYVNQ
jgi:hypothetical protein